MGARELILVCGFPKTCACVINKVLFADMLSFDGISLEASLFNVFNSE